MHDNYAIFVFEWLNLRKTVIDNTKPQVELEYVVYNSTADELDETLKRFLISVVGRCAPCWAYLPFSSRAYVLSTKPCVHCVYPPSF